MSSKLELAHRNQKPQQEVNQQIRRDSKFNDENANTRIDRSIRSGTGEKEKGQPVVIPGKNVQGGNRDLLKRKLVEVTNQPGEKSEVKRQRSPSFQCDDYAEDIISYTKSMEARFKYPDNFKDKFPGRGKSRSVLIDWIIQVQQYLDLSQQTLHLTVAMIDRFLISVALPLQKIQLLGITCLFIAAKYEEMFPPSIAKLLHLTDNSYLHNEVVQMELKVLNVIKCELHMPTPIIFLEGAMKVLKYQKDVEMMARYVLDLAVPFIKTVHFFPSVKAAAAIYLANQILNATAPRETTWMLSLSYFLACNEADILACAKGFARFLIRAETHKLQGAYTKHKHVSKLDILKNNPVILELSKC